MGRREFQFGHDRHAGEANDNLVGEIHHHVEKQQHSDFPGAFRRRLGNGRTALHLTLHIVPETYVRHFKSLLPTVSVTAAFLVETAHPWPEDADQDVHQDGGAPDAPQNLVAVRGAPNGLRYGRGLYVDAALCD